MTMKTQANYISSRNPRSRELVNSIILGEWSIFKGRWWQHVRFWFAAFLILFLMFQTSDSIEKIDVLYTLVFLIPLALIVYVNLYVLIPRFLKTERYLLFGFCVTALAFSGAYILEILFESWIDYILPEYYFISYYEVNTLIIFTASFLFLTSLLKLSKGWFKLMKLERMNATQQLQSLQSQINPHFLLNSLQTIYALSLEKSERTPKVILQLSEVLKYNLYDTDQSAIELEKELGMISDYVDMYRHRVDPGLVEIKLEVKGDPGELNIAPMLLIPFIENAFKHGLRGEPGHAFIHIGLSIAEGKLEFEVRNSYGSGEEVDLEENQGIGIENTRQRLDLLYPGKYQLGIEDQSTTFTVKLNMDLKQ